MGLIDKLDEGLNATSPEARDTLHSQAVGIVSEYQLFISSNTLISKIDDNPFTPVNIRGHIVEALAELSV